MAIRRTSATCQSVPTPRQSHWNWPCAAWMAAVSCSGVSCWLMPSVSRIACFCARPGTVAKTSVASRSQVPIAVPPSGVSRLIAVLASARVWGSIRIMPVPEVG